MPNKQIAVGAKTTVLMDVEKSFGVPPDVRGGVRLPVNAFGLKPSRAKNSAANAAVIVTLVNDVEAY